MGKKIINIPADTDSSGAVANDTGEGWRVTWMLAAGSTFSSGSIATSWEDYNNANIGVSQTNFGSSTDNEFYLAGVQIEVGEFDSNTIPSFPFESFANNLQKCQRYCQVYKTENAYGMMSPASVNSASVANGIFTFPTYLRAIPSLSTSGSFGLYSGDGGDAVSGIVIDANSDDASRLVCTISGSGFTDNSAAFLRAENDSDAKMTFDAEL